MHLLLLKMSPPPVPRAAASVGHGYDLDCGVCKSINYRIGETAQEKLLCTMQVQRPTLRAVGNSTDGVIEGRHEGIRSGGIAFGVPLVRSFCLSNGVGVEFNAWMNHGIVRRSGDAPRTREPAVLFPYLIDQYVAQFLYSTPLQHPHRPSPPSFQGDDRPARPALQPANAAPVHKSFCDWTSLFQINRPTASRQSLLAIVVDLDAANRTSRFRPNVLARGIET